MKYLLALALAAALLYPISARAEDDDHFSFSQTDKVAHFGVSYAATLTGYLIMHKLCPDAPIFSFMMSAVLVNTAGMIKEMAMDAKPSGGDVVGNLLGSAAAAGMVFTFKF